MSTFLLTLAFLLAGNVPEPVADTSTRSGLALRGEWHIVLAVSEGQPLEELKVGSKATFTADEFTLRFPELEINFTYALATKDRLELVAGVLPLPTLYQFDGNRLWLCWDYRGQRPKRFLSEPGSEKFLVVLERCKR